MPDVFAIYREDSPIGRGLREQRLVIRIFYNNLKSPMFGITAVGIVSFTTLTLVINLVLHR